MKKYAAVVISLALLFSLTSCGMIKKAVQEKTQEIISNAIAGDSASAGAGDSSAGSAGTGGSQSGSGNTGAGSNGSGSAQSGNSQSGNSQSGNSQSGIAGGSSSGASSTKDVWPSNKFTKGVPSPETKDIGTYRMYSMQTGDFSSVEENKADVILFAMKWETMDDAKAYVEKLRSAGFTKDEKVDEMDSTEPIMVGDTEVYGPTSYDWIGSDGSLWIEASFYRTHDGDVQYSTLSIANYDFTAEDED
ncbi:MAG: hypothetical protein LBR77_07260 [Lachnospiraceae bacterium]|jgi:hypothetical protein|nr:hypothetical protein [Lachnospiraceae bacterium]